MSLPLIGPVVDVTSTPPAIGAAALAALAAGWLWVSGRRERLHRRETGR